MSKRLHDTVMAVLGPSRAAVARRRRQPRRRHVAALVALLPGVVDLGRHERDPAQHPRRARPRPAPRPQSRSTRLHGARDSVPTASTGVERRCTLGVERAGSGLWSGSEQVRLAPRATAARSGPTTGVASRPPALDHAVAPRRRAARLTDADLASTAITPSRSPSQSSPITVVRRSTASSTCSDSVASPGSTNRA